MAYPTPVPTPSPKPNLATYKTTSQPLNINGLANNPGLSYSNYPANFQGPVKPGQQQNCINTKRTLEL